MNFTVIVSQMAWDQLLKHVIWYESEQVGLGDRFEAAVFEHLSLLERSPFAQRRYDQIRCVPIKGFPYMFHIGIDEEKKVVHVYALIHTARNPESNWGQDDWIVSEPDFYYAPQKVVAQ